MRVVMTSSSVVAVHSVVPVASPLVHPHWCIPTVPSPLFHPWSPYGQPRVLSRVDTPPAPSEDGLVSTSEPRPHVVIVGGGFGGLYAARALADSWARVTLLDRRNHHLFQPPLYH